MAFGELIMKTIVFIVAVLSVMFHLGLAYLGVWKMWATSDWADIQHIKSGSVGTDQVADARQGPNLCTDDTVGAPCGGRVYLMVFTFIIYWTISAIMPMVFIFGEFLLGIGMSLASSIDNKPNVIGRTLNESSNWLGTFFEALAESFLMPTRFRTTGEKGKWRAIEDLFTFARLANLLLGSVWISIYIGVAQTNAVYNGNLAGITINQDTSLWSETTLEHWLDSGARRRMQKDDQMRMDGTASLLWSGEVFWPWIDYCAPSNFQDWVYTEGQTDIKGQKYNTDTFSSGLFCLGDRNDYYYSGQGDLDEFLWRVTKDWTVGIGAGFPEMDMSGGAIGPYGGTDVTPFRPAQGTNENDIYCTPADMLGPPGSDSGGTKWPVPANFWVYAKMGVKVGMMDIMEGRRRLDDDDDDGDGDPPPDPAEMPLNGNNPDLFKNAVGNDADDIFDTDGTALNRFAQWTTHCQDSTNAATDICGDAANTLNLYDNAETWANNFCIVKKTEYTNTNLMFYSFYLFWINMTIVLLVHAFVGTFHALSQQMESIKSYLEKPGSGPDRLPGGAATAPVKYTFERRFHGRDVWNLGLPFMHTAPYVAQAAGKDMEMMQMHKQQRVSAVPTMRLAQHGGELKVVQ